MHHFPTLSLEKNVNEETVVPPFGEEVAKRRETNINVHQPSEIIPTLRIKGISYFPFPSKYLASANIV